MRYVCRIFASGTALTTEALILAAAVAAYLSYAATADAFAASDLPVARGLVAFIPTTPPAYDAVASKSYLIITLTGVESVRPSSDGSVFASRLLGDLAALNVSLAVGRTAVGCSRAAFPPLAPDATPLTAKLRATTSRGSARKMGVRLRRHGSWFPLDKVLVSSPRSFVSPDSNVPPGPSRRSSGIPGEPSRLGYLDRGSSRNGEGRPEAAFASSAERKD